MFEKLEEFKKYSERVEKCKEIKGDLVIKFHNVDIFIGSKSDNSRHYNYEIVECLKDVIKNSSEVLLDGAFTLMRDRLEAKRKSAKIEAIEFATGEEIK